MEIKAGIAWKSYLRVTSEMTAFNVGSGKTDVLSTPTMLMLMEKTAFDSVEDFLDSGYTTVGTAVELRHLAAVGVGAELTCESNLVKIDKNLLFFEITVKKGEKIIGTAKHIRAIVEIDRFLAKIC
jgi:predicted thioesterase